jgi:hypothetical protein
MVRLRVYSDVEGRLMWAEARIMRRCTSASMTSKLESTLLSLLVIDILKLSFSTALAPMVGFKMSADYSGCFDIFLQIWMRRLSYLPRAFLSFLPGAIKVRSLSERVRRE